MSDEEVHNTYKLGMLNVTVSKWLTDIVKQFAPCTLISNSINSEIFNVHNPINKRNPKSLIFHYRTASIKGGIYAIQLIEKIHSKYPDFKFTAVSTEPKPKNFPEYITYVHGASPEEVSKLNNQHSLFVCTSVAEGFGLPGLEGMACGCALVSSGYYGVFDYAIDEENALISPTKDVDKMLLNVEKLIEDDALRIHLAQTGYECAMKRTLDIAGNQLEKLVISN